MYIYLDLSVEVQINVITELCTNSSMQSTFKRFNLWGLSSGPET